MFRPTTTLAEDAYRRWAVPVSACTIASGGRQRHRRGEHGNRNGEPQAFRTQAPNEKCAGDGGHRHDRRQHAVVEHIGQHNQPSRHQEGRPAGYPRDCQNAPVSRPVRNNRLAVPDSPPPRARAEERRRGESPPGTFEKLGGQLTQRDVRKPAGGDRRLRRIDLSLTEERTRHCDAGPRGKQQQPAHPGAVAKQTGQSTQRQYRYEAAPHE